MEYYYSDYHGGTLPLAKGKKNKNDYANALQEPLFAPRSDWKPTPVVDLPDWSTAKVVGIDTETKDPGIAQKLGPGVRRGGYIVGVSFTLDGGKPYYLPYRHEGGDNIAEDEALRYLRGNAKAFKGEYLGANLGYDLDYLWEDGIESPDVELYRDVQIADPLIYELHDWFSLDEIGKRWGVHAKEHSLLEEAAKAYNVSPKGGLWRLPARYVGPYGENDTESLFPIYRQQKNVLDRDELWKVFDLESRVMPALVRMRRRGVRVDMDKLEQIEKWSLDTEMECLKLVKDETGYDIGVGNIWKAHAIAPALQAAGLPLGRTAQGAPNIDADILDKFNHPVAKWIARARKVNKLRTTFAASIRKYEVNGRIHCTFNQIARETEDGDQKGARYGRLSSTDPNMQQQPARDDFAKLWRSIYLPEDGALWGALDYSQQEPRWTTHFAALLDLPRAQEAAEKYRTDHSTDNHTMMTKLIFGDDVVNWDNFKAKRGESKIIFLGLCYGEGGAKLCHDLGLDTRWAFSTHWGSDLQYFDTQREAMQAKMDNGGDGYYFEAAGEAGQDIIDNFSANVPYVPALADRVKKRAMQMGFIKTPMGRRLHFPLKASGRGYDWAHKALNRLIQGSSADQTKLAVVQMDAAGYYLQLQVHDEIDGSFATEEEAKAAGRIMMECVNDITKPELPFLVDVECGENWGDSMED